MQIRDHVDKRFRCEGPNRKISDHRQKRKAKKKAKQLGSKMARAKFKRDFSLNSHRMWMLCMSAEARPYDYSVGS